MHDYWDRPDVLDKRQEHFGMFVVVLIVALSCLAIGAWVGVAHERRRPPTEAEVVRYICTHQDEYYVEPATC